MSKNLNICQKREDAIGLGGNSNYRPAASLHGNTLMRFSVIIPNLHTPTIDRTIEALEHQAFDRTQYEVIVVGMDQYNRVYTSDLVRFDRSDCPLSPAAARNRGAAQARGDIIVFTDADCVAHPDWLAVLAERFADSSVNVVGGGVAFEPRGYWTIADSISSFHDYLASLPSGERQLLASLNLAIRRQVFMEVGGFDERRPIGEDSDLSIRLRRQGYVLYFESRAVVRHLPLRNRPVDLLRHGYYYGKYSIKVDPRYATEKGLPSILRTRLGLVFGAPIIAAGVTMRIFKLDRQLWQHWYTMPAIFAAKLAWCLGAATRPW